MHLAKSAAGENNLKKEETCFWQFSGFEWVRHLYCVRQRAYVEANGNKAGRELHCDSVETCPPTCAVKEKSLLAQTGNAANNKSNEEE